MALAKNGKSGLRPGTARLIASAFLLLGISLGVFDAPQYFSKVTGYRLPVTLNFPYRLGLDIQGGTHLVYRADFEGLEVNDKGETMQGLREVIERRVNAFGVSEPVVQVERSGEEWRLIVELAGIKDINEAIRLIGKTPQLEFREVDPAATSTIVFLPAELTGKYLKRAEVRFDPNTNQPYIAVNFNSEGAKLFEEITEKNIDRPLGIFLDGQLTQAPIVKEKIAGGEAVITGRFTPEEARARVRDLNAGALPVPVRIIAQQTVGPTLGQESLVKSIRASVWGLLYVALFMIFWYRLPGVLAVLALLFYAAAVLAIFKLIPVTLTVAGVAGFILSMGMAVDANILIFERLKEEMRGGKILAEAVREGFGRAWTSIRDSNVSSLITSAILYWMGTSVVQGFALTLAIGILVSMFSAIWVTRILLMTVMTKRLEGLRFIFLSGISQ